MRNQEHREQVAVFEYIKMRAATCPALRLAFAVPNGGARNAITGALLKAEGCRPGVPDIILPVPINGYTGLAIELKAKGGRLSPEQKWWIEELRVYEWRALVCFGARDAIEVIEDYIGGSNE